MKKIYSILFIVTILISGCSEDFLELTSKSELANATFWSSSADAEMAIVSCYNALQSTSLYNNSKASGAVQQWDYMCDNGFCRWQWMNGAKIERGEHATTNGLLNGLWSESYKAIVRCNWVIENIQEMSADLIEPDYAKQVIAEAKFIRALSYNLLSMTFEDVPLITSLQTVSESEVPKNPKSEIVNFIITDLEGCVEDLPGKGATEWGRATKGAGYALLARINLYNENWTDAATWAQKVLDIDYSLFPDFHGLFQAENEQNNEVIFPVPFIKGPEGSGASFAGYWSGQKVMTYQEVLSGLANDYYCIDGIPTSESPLFNPDKPLENRDPRYDATIVGPGAIYNGVVVNLGKTWTNYAQRKYTEEILGENHFDADEDFYVFRLGEVILMKAEALAESGAPSQEIFALINQLRDRPSVMMPHVDQVEVDNYYGGSIVEMVRHERRIETAFEGLRYLDVKRWGIQKERNVDYYMEHEKAALTKLPSRYWDPKFVVWPLPQAEVDLNSQLDQNTLWQ